jgi:DNA-directed RNA polymerase subunit RPC12/RpoP
MWVSAAPCRPIIKAVKRVCFNCGTEHGQSNCPNCSSNRTILKEIKPTVKDDDNSTCWGGPR